LNHDARNHEFKIPYQHYPYLKSVQYTSTFGSIWIPTCRWTLVCLLVQFIFSLSFSLLSYDRFIASYKAIPQTAS